MPLSIDALLVLRFVKLLAVVALGAGTLGAFLPASFEDRQRFAYALAGPGFGISWLMGLFMAWGSGVSLFASWILGAVALSLVSINVVLWAVGVDGRRGPRSAGIAIGTLVTAIALMVWKP